MKKFIYLFLLFSFTAAGVYAQHSVVVESEVDEPKRPIIDDLGISLDPEPSTLSKAEASGGLNIVKATEYHSDSGSGQEEEQSNDEDGEDSFTDQRSSEQVKEVENIATELKRNIKIYPNPAINDLKVEFGDEYEIEISLVNMIGQKVYTTQGTFKEIEIQVSDYPEGTYFLTIQVGEDRIIRRIEVSN